MDLFAVILLTITIFTLCGIFIFIFICSIQPKILRYFHRKTNRTYHITASKKEHEIQNDVNINNNMGLITNCLSDDVDKRTYLKILERSLRSGRKIKEEMDDTIYNTTNNSDVDLMYLVQRYINENLSTTTTTTTTTNI